MKGRIRSNWLKNERFPQNTPLSNIYGKAWPRLDIWPLIKSLSRPMLTMVEMVLEFTWRKKQGIDSSCEILTFDDLGPFNDLEGNFSESLTTLIWAITWLLLGLIKIWPRSKFDPIRTLTPYYKESIWAIVMDIMIWKQYNIMTTTAWTSSS